MSVVGFEARISTTKNQDEIALVLYKQHLGLTSKTIFHKDPVLCDILHNPEWCEPVHKRFNFKPIAYSHETGEITLVTGGGVENFNPNDDEHLARLVRKLKAFAPTPESEAQPNLPNILPQPTAEQFANRTIYTNPAHASGIDRYRKGPKVASEAETIAILNNLVAKLGAAPP